MRGSHAGWLGVNLFFVLSGFLITRILIETRDSPDYYRSFYSRRALRILPAYLALLLILLAAGAIQAGFAALCIFFLANMAPILGMAMQYRPLWSLAVEEHYYLVWPSIVRRLSLRQLAAIVICVAIATPLVRWIAFRSGIAGAEHLHVVQSRWSRAWIVARNHFRVVEGLASNTTHVFNCNDFLGRES